MAPNGSTPPRGRYNHPVTARPSRAVTVSSVGTEVTGPRLGLRSMRSPLPRARIDEFDGARHVGALDRHRHHRSAGTDRQFTGDRIPAGGMGRSGTVGVLEDL